MKVVYIAGPYRAKTPWDVEQNVRKAEKYALRVAKLGAMPLCPHTMSRFFNGQCSEQFWLDGTAELVRRCDAMFVVPHYEVSEGTELEITLAESLLMPCFLYQISQLKAWLPK